MTFILYKWVPWGGNKIGALRAMFLAAGLAPPYLFPGTGSALFTIGPTRFSVKKSELKGEHSVIAYGSQQFSEDVDAAMHL